MKIIKKIADEMIGNVREAREKITTAYELADTDPQAAQWYREMASSHLAFNANGHSVVSKLISEYKESAHYKEHPEYAAAMQDVWKAEHADIMKQTAEVQTMITMFK